MEELLNSPIIQGLIATFIGGGGLATGATGKHFWDKRKSNGIAPRPEVGIHFSISVDPSVKVNPATAAALVSLIRELFSSAAPQQAPKLDRPPLAPSE